MNKNKDWTGNRVTGFAQIGARNFAFNEREDNDFYASPPKALEDLLVHEHFENVWECACGMGHLSEILKKYAIHGKSSDLVNRGYGEVSDFLRQWGKWDGDIITNPPYKYAQDFVEKALETISEKRKVAMLLKIQFLEGKGRKSMFEKYPPKTVYVWSGRISCAMNGDFASIKHGSPMMFAWFVWEKGFTGDPIIKWL